MKKSVLPVGVESQLKQEGITKADIIAQCPVDLSLSCQYIKGGLFLTKKYIGVYQSKPVDNQVQYFRGTNKKESNSQEEQDYEIRWFPLGETDQLRLERYVATNIVIMQYKGEPYQIVASSNLYLEELNDFIKKYRYQKEHPEENGIQEEEEQEEEILYCPVCGTMYPDPKRKICPKCMNKRSIFLRTMGYFTRYKVRFSMLFVCYFAGAALNLVWPYLSGAVLFDGILERNDSFLKQYGLAGKYVTALLLLVLVSILTKVVQMCVSTVQGILSATIVADTVKDMKKDVFASMGKLSLSFFSSKQTGGLMTRVLSDADHVTDFYLDGFPSIFIHGFTIIASFILMFRLNVAMSVVACILLPLLVIMSVRLKPKLWSLSGRRHRAERAVNSKVNDNLTGVRVVKAFGQQEKEMDRFESTNEKLKDAEVRIVRYNNRFSILYNLVQEISSIWVWILGVILVVKTKDIKLGVLITFVGYIGQLNGPMRFFSGIFHMWSDSINSAQRMFEIVDAVSTVQEKENPIHIPEPKGQIDLDHVTFGYDKNHPVLKDINLHIRPGEMLGIVGRSGAGKTTLVNLISRLYDTNEGDVMLDGVNVKDIAFTDLRRNVAMVSQDTYIFMGTVAENIAYANPKATRGDIIQAAVLASAHEFISRMPDGYDTMIGASGKDLSGGERQRISIARAILANPKILILDEATASVDTKTEKEIQKSIDYLVKNRTTLSIAHRLSTLRDVDRLIVIDQGRITEEGTHEELKKLGGTYFKLSELQTKSLALKGLE